MKKTVFYAFAAALALVSCAKEQAPVVSNEVVTRIYAAMDPVKSTVGIDGTTAHFSWTSGEVISVATAEGFTDFTCTNTSTGEFTHAGEVTPLNVAVSPAQTTDKFTSETNFKVGLPAVYTYVEGKTNALMIGTKGEGDKYIFGHAAALLSITYENLPEGTKGISVTADKNISGSNIELSGTSASAIEIKNDNAGLSEKTVSISHDATVGNTASRTYYLPLPTGTYEELTFRLLNNDATISESTSKTVKNVTLERGNFAQIPTVTLAQDFTVPYIVGEMDCSSGWNTAWSKLFSIEKGKVLHLEFVNHSSKVNNWNNWDLFVTNNKPYIADEAQRNASGYAEYFVLRSDNYGWGTNFSKNRLSSNYNWDTFKNDMDGATINMTIEYTSLGSILVKAQTSTGYEERYTHPISVSDGTIGAFLFCDNSYFEFKKVWYSNSRKTSISGLESAYNYYVANAELSLDTIGWPRDVVAVYNDGDKESVLPSDITFPTGKTLAATAGNQEYAVSFNGNNYTLTIPVIKGTSAFGSTTLTTVNWWDAGNWSPALGEVTGGNSLTKRMFVYSACGENFHGPYAHVCKAGWTGLSVFRWDNFGWNDAGSSAFDNIDANKERGGDDCWNWDLYKPMQNQARVDITWTNNGGTTATVRYDMQYWNGNNVYQIYKNIAIDGSIQTNCACEMCYVVIID